VIRNLGINRGKTFFDMKLLIQLVLTGSVIVVAAGVNEDCLEKGFAYPGFDINTNGDEIPENEKRKYVKNFKGTALECQKLCQATTDGKCKFFTYIEKTEREEAKCFLKTSNEGKTKEEGKTSGPAFCNQAVHCEWDEWKNGNCSLSCGDGERNDTREKSKEEANGGKCDGKPTRTEHCKIKECPIHCEWSIWKNGTCSESCGGGYRHDTRKVVTTAKHDGTECEGATEANVSCNTEECPVNGGWGDWRNWKDCSVACGGGDQDRTRVCDDPAPQYGGNDCSVDGSSDTETKRCNENPCPTFVWRKAHKECKSSDKKLGTFRNDKKTFSFGHLVLCAEACRAERSCRFFIYSDNGNGKCYAEWTASSSCSEGWENDEYNFYELV